MFNWLHKLRTDLAVRFDMPGLMPGIKGAANEVSFSVLSDDAVSAYIAEKTLMIAHKSTRLHVFGDKAVLPNEQSKTFQYTRYERLSLPTATLTEGTTPGNTAMTITTVTFGQLRSL